MIIWAHGLEGSPQGTKVQALRAAGFEVVAPDCRNLVLSERVRILDALSTEHARQRPLLAGSSYGGLAAAFLAARHLERFRGLLLCAPALHHLEDPVTDLSRLVPPPELPVRVIHGTRDDVVPISTSRSYVLAGKGDAVLEEVDDDHRLVASLARIVTLAAELGG